MVGRQIVIGGAAIALQNRQPSGPILSPSPAVVVGVAIAALGGLTLLAYKIRTAEPAATARQKRTNKLERQDLLEGGEPENALERIIQVANRPGAHATVILSTLGIGLALVRVGQPNAGGTLLFATALFVMQASLRFGWPYLERYYETDEPARNDPDSLRFEGFSTDTKVFLTLLAAIFLVVIGLALAESIAG